MTAPPSVEAEREGPRLPPDNRSSAPGAARALSLLLLINLFNYIDRYVLAAVVPNVQQELLSANDPNADFKMGLLSTAFLVVYMLTSPVFGVLGDRTSRWRLIAIGVILWSLASGASGLATGFAAMLITRCFVGVGEAAYGPVAPSVISDLYPVARRGQVLSWFYVAMPVGSALGYALGGQVVALGRTSDSWRWAFYLVVAPGLLLGLWALLMRDPPRGAVDARDASSRRFRAKDYLILLRTRSYVLNTSGMTAMTFAIGAISWWMPKYLEDQNVAPVGAMVPSVFLGLLTVVAGLVGTLSGGLAGDWLRPRIPGAYFLVSGVGLLLTVPCIVAFLLIPFPLAWVFVFLAEFFLFFNTGPTNTILANVTHPSMRATAFAVNILVIHLLGDAISPPIVGAISDFAKNVLKAQNSLAYGFVVVSVLLVVGGIIWLWGMRHLQRDTEAAPHRLS
jgi:MFS family permease